MPQFPYLIASSFGPEIVYFFHACVNNSWSNIYTEQSQIIIRKSFSLSCIGEGYGNPLQCSFLENPRGSRAWWAAVYGAAQSQTQLKRLRSSSSIWKKQLFLKSPSLPRDRSSKRNSIVINSLLGSFNNQEILRLTKGELEIPQACPTLCDPMDCSLPVSSVHGILQARVLEWVTISFSRDLPNPGLKPGSPTLQADALPSESSSERGE